MIIRKPIKKLAILASELPFSLEGISVSTSSSEFSCCPDSEMGCSSLTSAFSPISIMLLLAVIANGEKLRVSAS